MRFLIPINEAKEGESLTMVSIETGTNNARSNKKILMSYFKQVGVPTNQLKKVMKAMGFWGANLTRGNIGKRHD